MRRGDRYALRIVGQWLAMRLRRLLAGVRRADVVLVREELLMLYGTACGLLYGARLRDAACRRAKERAAA